MILVDEAATEALGARLAEILLPGDVITLSGPLGVGKTALARAVIRSLGHSGEVPSPSFAIVQPYEDVEPPVWHVDLYRVEKAGELEELGLDSASHAALLVEWPDRASGSGLARASCPPNRRARQSPRRSDPAAGDDAWPDALRLTLDFAQGGARRLTADVPPSWQQRWPPQ